VLAGHDHNYERFAEMRPDRRPADLAAGERGVRLFTVGTGGVAQRGKGSTKAGSQRFANGYGVLRLTLGDAGTYAWSFKNAAGSSIGDSGSGTCLPEASTPAPGGPASRARPGDPGPA
jgi:acid phosphatase type 7